MTGGDTLPLTEVIAQEPIADKLYRMVIEAPVNLKEQGYSPGQFLHFRVTDSLDFVLRRPISLCLADEALNRLTVVYRAQGEGTRRIAEKRPGDAVDVLGPLGNGFSVHQEDERVLLIGGGIGVPPLLELARELTRQGKRALAILGFQQANQVILLDEFASFSEVAVATDDGSAGVKGLVTDLFHEERLQGVTRYYACGPTPMLRAVKEAMAARGVPGYLSLEERMGCGIGLCAGCVHKISRKGTVRQLKTCREGPVFPAEEVVFE